MAEELQQVHVFDWLSTEEIGTGFTFYRPPGESYVSDDCNYDEYINIAREFYRVKIVGDKEYVVLTESSHEAINIYVKKTEPNVLVEPRASSYCIHAKATFVPCECHFADNLFWPEHELKTNIHLLNLPKIPHVGKTFLIEHPEQGGLTKEFVVRNVCHYFRDGKYAVVLTLDRPAAEICDTSSFAKMPQISTMVVNEAYFCRESTGDRPQCSVPQGLARQQSVTQARKQRLKHLHLRNLRSRKTMLTKPLAYTLPACIKGVIFGPAGELALTYFPHEKKANKFVSHIRIGAQDLRVKHFAYTERGKCLLACCYPADQKVLLVMRKSDDGIDQTILDLQTQQGNKGHKRILSIGPIPQGVDAHILPLGNILLFAVPIVFRGRPGHEMRLVACTKDLRKLARAKHNIGKHVNTQYAVITRIICSSDNFHVIGLSGNKFYVWCKGDRYNSSEKYWSNEDFANATIFKIKEAFNFPICFDVYRKDLFYCIWKPCELKLRKAVIAGPMIVEEQRLYTIRCTGVIGASVVSARYKKVFYSVDNRLYEYDIMTKISKIQLVLANAPGITTTIQGMELNREQNVLALWYREHLFLVPICQD